MKICTSCGAELANEAVICRECGSLQPTEKKNSDSEEGFFSMPYLSSTASINNASKSEKTEKTENTKTEAVPSGDEAALTTTDKKVRQSDIDAITDPRERAFAKQDRRNRMIRIGALIAAAVIVVVLVVYLVTRNTGYYRTLDKYIDGLNAKDSSGYSAIVPDLYLINAEKLYDLSRPEMKANTKNYLSYVKTQIAADYGDDVKQTCEIIAEDTSDDKASADTLEDTIFSTYGTELSITEVAYLNVRITTKGSVTQTKESKTLTFFKYDGNWYSLDAMQVIQFANENAGYNMW